EWGIAKGVRDPLGILLVRLRAQGGPRPPWYFACAPPRTGGQRPPWQVHEITLIQNPTCRFRRTSRPASGAMSFRNEAWRRAVTSNRLLACTITVTSRAYPQGRQAAERLTMV